MNSNFRIPRWEELPDVDLYLDQVISLIDSSIGRYVNEDGKKMITRTMVNNYVKQKIINPPIKKKYDKLTVASLFVIAILKPVFSMNEISKLITLAMEANRSEVSYNQFCIVTEEAVEKVFSGESLPERGDLNDPQYILRSVCMTFACKLYVREIYFNRIEDSEPFIIEY